MTRELAEIFRTVKDPRVSGEFISVTGVDCAADLRQAKVFYSVVGDEGTRESVRRGLASAAGYIRSQLAARLNMRVTPELTFIFDTSMEKGADITKLLRKIELEGSASEENEDGDN